MKKTMKGIMPYIIIGAVIDAIIGAVTAKVTIDIMNSKEVFSRDYKALKRFIKDMGGSATHIKLDDIDEDEVPEDIRNKANDQETMGD